MYAFTQRHSKHKYRKEHIIVYFGNKPCARSLCKDLKMYRIFLDGEAIKKLLHGSDYILEKDGCRTIFSLEKIIYK